MKQTSREETAMKVRKAIKKMKNNEEKLSVVKIASVAGLERKTIYNNPHILEMCKQAIELQKSSQSILETEESKPAQPNVLEFRYKKLKEELRLEREKNSQLLFQNKQLVLMNHNLEARLFYLEEKQSNVTSLKKK